MDRNKAHDILHMWHGIRAQDCPVCNESLKDDAEIIAAAKDVAVDNYYPRVNPDLVNPLYCDEDGKPKEATEQTTVADEKTEEDKPTVTAGEAEKEEKPAKPKENRHPVSVMTEVMSFSDDKKTVPSKIKIIPTGMFKTSKYGNLEITKEHLLEMKKNFEDGVRAGGALTGLPIDIEHGETQHRDAAAGWMKRLDVQDDGAYAEVEWTSLGLDLLEKGLYKFFSPEFTFDYVDNEQSFEISNVLIGGGIVNKPLFDHSLSPLVMSEQSEDKNLTNENGGLMLLVLNDKDTQSKADVSTQNQSESSLENSKKEEKPMDLQTILAKEKSTRTSDEQTFVAANLDKLSDEQKVSEGFIVNPVAPDAAPQADSAPQGEVTVTASEKPNTVTISAAEYQTLKEGASQGTLAFKELEKKEITETVRKLQFNEKGGKFAPAQGDQLINLMVAMSEPQRTELTKVLEALPDRKVFGELGSDDDMDKSKIADLLTIKAKEIAASKGIGLSEAYKVAREENPDLRDYSLQPAGANA
jgi:phage I-like protein